MKKALILQGWYQKLDSNWYQWLKSELEKKSYETYLPELPTMHTDLIDMEAQIAFLNKLLNLDKDTIVIGHSIGAVLALRLGERYQLGKIFTVAGWDFDDLTPEHRLFWKNKINHEQIKENVDEIYCISSDNDPYFTASTEEEMSKRLNAKFILIPGKGHFTDKFGISKIPEILEFI